MNFLTDLRRNFWKIIKTIWCMLNLKSIGKTQRASFALYRRHPICGLKE